MLGNGDGSVHVAKAARITRQYDGDGNVHSEQSRIHHKTVQSSIRAAPAHGIVVHIHFPQAPHHVQLVACPISLTILLVVPALQGHSCCSMADGLLHHMAMLVRFSQTIEKPPFCGS